MTLQTLISVLQRIDAPSQRVLIRTRDEDPHAIGLVEITFDEDGDLTVILR